MPTGRERTSGFRACLGRTIVSAFAARRALGWVEASVVSDGNAVEFEQRVLDELALARAATDRAGKAAHLDRAAVYATARERAARDRQVEDTRDADPALSRDRDGDRVSHRPVGSRSEIGS